MYLDDPIPAHFIGDPRVDATLGRLYRAALRTDPPARQAAAARGLDEGVDGFYAAMKEAYLPVTPDLGRLLYLLVRSTCAKTVVEFGASLGISSLWIAAALRANGGRLLTTEIDAHKAKRACDHLREAGLGDYVQMRVGPAEQTLREPFAEPIDLVLLDGAKSAYLPVLCALEPSLRSGALIVADNTDMAGARPFLDYVRVPGQGYGFADIFTEALGARHSCKLLVREGIDR